MSERIPTDVLVERARVVAENLRGSALPSAAEWVTALADRLGELAALEPVGALLAAMRESVSSSLYVEIAKVDGRAQATLWLGGRHLVGPDADTPEAALEALAEQVRGRG